MNYKIFTLITLAATLFATSSCLTEDTQNKDVNYDDTAIMSFTLGKLKQVRDTIGKNGKDSTYIAICAGNKYKFHIDHANAKIYNTEMLPYGIKTNAVLASIKTKNGGFIAIKSLTNDTFKPYRTNDSIDFSKERKLYVYANNSKVYRIYTVTVNVEKQQNNNNIAWTDLKDYKPFETLSATKAVCTNDKIFVAGVNETTTTLYSTSITDGNTWEKYSHTFSKDAYKNIVTLHNTLFILDNHQVLSSNDGEHWTVVNEDNNIVSLFASPLSLYAITADNKIKISTDNGKTWKEEVLSSDVSDLPICSISDALLFSTNSGNNLKRLLFIGYNSNKNMVEWTRLINTANNSNNYNWNTIESFSSYTLPEYKNLIVTSYNNCPIALGLTSDNKIAPLLISYDQGITWKKNKAYTIPSSTTTAKTMAATIDKNNNLWIINGSKVWRRLLR